MQLEIGEQIKGRLVFGWEGQKEARKGEDLVCQEEAKRKPCGEGDVKENEMSQHTLAGSPPHNWTQQGS